MPHKFKILTNKEIKSRLNLEGTITVEAAKGEDQAARFFLEANTGKPFWQQHIGEKVIIDLEGSKFSKGVSPVIFDHDVSKRVGHTTAQAIIPFGRKEVLDGATYEGPLVAAKGIVSSSSIEATNFAKDAKSGYPFQVSVGADIESAYFLEDGESAVINGKSWKGPLIVATKTSIYELSITVLGADGDTKASLIAASRNKGDVMDFDAWLNTLGFVKATMPESQINALKKAYEAEINAKKTKGEIKADKSDKPADVTPVDLTKEIQAAKTEMAKESNRQASITKVAAKFSGKDIKFKLEDKELEISDLAAHAISENWDVDKFELSCLRAELSSPQTGPSIHISPQIRDMGKDVISCAMLRAAGIKANKTQEWTGEKYGLEVWYKDEVLEASMHKDLRNIGLHQLMDMQIAAAGERYHGNRKSDDFINATGKAIMKVKANASGSTTLDITNIFDDVAHKMMLAAYNSANTTWREIAAKVNVSDFKTHNMYRLGMEGGYHKVGIDGELKHGGFYDQKYTIAAETYGKIVGLDRKHFINDDMDAFSRMMSFLGLEGARTIEELVYVYLLGNLATLFPTNNSLGNYISGAATDLTIAGLTAASLAYDNQVDPDNAPLMVEADRILVGTQDKIVAGQLFNQTTIETSSTSPTFQNNPHASAFRPIVTPYLNNTSIKQRVDFENLGAAITGQDSNQWFMLGNPSNPQGATLNVALLNGVETPVLQQADAPFDTLGARFRAYHDVGIGSGDPKFMLRSKGAA